jgi:hypothetical protein
MLHLQAMPIQAMPIQAMPIQAMPHSSGVFGRKSGLTPSQTSDLNRGLALAGPELAPLYESFATSRLARAKR